LDGGAPFYRTYRTADGKYLAVGAIEPRFYAAFRAALGLDDPFFDAQMDRSLWPAMCDRIAAVIASRPLRGWQDAMAQPDACMSPVLTLEEAASHPQIQARQTLTGTDRVEPAAAPRFLGEPNAPPRNRNRSSVKHALRGWTVSDATRAALAAAAHE
jgi:alpha-methylacyl-CoA racemase